MPLWIDPEWEYWTPDPECAATPIDRWSFFDFRLFREQNLGFRFGVGDPDAFRPRLASPKPDRIQRRRVCPVCQFTFPARKRQECCSSRCANVVRNRSRRKRAQTLVCPICQKEFSPPRAESRFCSPHCGSVNSGRGLRRVDDELFKAMYLRGDKMTDIAHALNVTLEHTRKIRKRCQLTPRPVGNHSRRKS